MSCCIAQKYDSTTPFIVEKASIRSQYVQIQTIADKLRPSVRKEFLQAIDGIRSDVKMNKVIAAINTGNVERVLRELGLETLAVRMSTLQTQLQSAFATAAAATVSHIPKAMQLQASFDILNPHSVAFLRQYKFDLIQGIDNVTREGIRDVLITGFETGRTPAQMAKEIRQFVGLTARQTAAARNYMKLLVSEGRNPAQVDRMLAKYVRRQLKMRAENIARTETIRAANAGQLQAWKQMRQNNIITDTARRKWIITPDDRLCPICREIPGMNQGGIGLDDQFQTPKGIVPGPPAHPRCRCATGLVFS